MMGLLPDSVKLGGFVLLLVVNSRERKKLDELAV